MCNASENHHAVFPARAEAAQFTPGASRAGYALLLAMLIVGLAAALGLTMLSETALQSQAAFNMIHAAQADTLVDSGMNLAFYYLLNPWKAPVLTDGYWPGGSNISFGNSVPGVVDVSVSRPGADINTYEIAVTARIGQAGQLQLSRAARSRVIVAPGVRILGALGSREALLVGSTVSVTGDVFVGEQLTNWGLIFGNVYAVHPEQVDNYRFISGTVAPVPPGQTITVPKEPDIQSYSSYVYSDGQVYQRQTLPVGSLGGAGLTQLDPSPGNPAGIFYYDGNFTLKNGAKVNGTLIVKGDVLLDGTNVAITSQSGYPALIIMGNLKTRAYKSLTVNGLTWIKDDIKADSGTSWSTSLTFNGALIFPNDCAISGAAAASIKCVHTPDNLVLPDLDRSQPRNIQVLWWKRG